LPVQQGLSDEPSFLVLLVDHVVPLIVASSNLFGVHTHNEVTHDTVSLRLHLGHEMLLFAFVLFDFDFEVFNLSLVLRLSSIELFDVVKVKFLTLNTAHLLPYAES